MDNESAIVALGALAQATRLDAFRLLVRHEPEGLPAGEVAKALDVPQNTMSVHLATLARAGLVTSERRSRIINYRADLDQLKALTLFLVKDCCGGNASLCQPFAVANADVLRPPVGMMDQGAITLRLPGIERLLQGIQNEVCVHGTADPPAHNAPGVHVDHEGHVQPALPG